MSVAIVSFYSLYAGMTFFLAWYDIKTGLLPDRITCPLLWSGLLFSIVVHPQHLSSRVLGAIAGYLIFASIYWGYRGICKREGLGYGDVKFLAALGAWHGWESLPELITLAADLAVLFACLQSIRHLSFTVLKNPLPFGPFLAAAGFVLAAKTWISFPL